MDSDILVVGVQQGALASLADFVRKLPRDFSVPVVIAYGREMDEAPALLEKLWSSCELPVLEPDDKTAIRAQRVFLGPAGYQLLVDQGFLSFVPLRAFGREWILDHFFESAADVYGSRALAVLLRGDQADGERGLAAVKGVGGKAVEVHRDRPMGQVRFPAQPSPAWLDRIAGVQ